MTQRPRIGWLHSLPLVLTGLLCSSLALAHDVSAVARERMQNGGIIDYIWTGAEHMLTGYDHLLFLFGVMFFLTRFVDMIEARPAYQRAMARSGA